MSFFDKLNDWVNNTEGSLVNFLTAFSPWLAPLAPAYMTYDHMLNILLFDPWLSWVLAGVVEILGFSTVSTGLSFWFYNRANKAKKKKAPLFLVVISFGFYLMLIIVSNVVIDAAKEFEMFEKDLQMAVLVVRALLTLQTIPAALIVAARTGHRDILDEIKQEKEERDDKKNETSSNTESQETGLTRREKIGQLSWAKAKNKLSEEDKLFILNSVWPNVSKEFGLIRKTAVNWRNNCLRDFGNQFDRSE